MTVFENMEDKTVEKAFEFYWQGYQLGQGTESMSELDKKVARKRFERYLERNYK